MIKWTITKLTTVKSIIFDEKYEHYLNDWNQTNILFQLCDNFMTMWQTYQ